MKKLIALLCMLAVLAPAPAQAWGMLAACFEHATFLTMASGRSLAEVAQVGRMG